MAASTFTSKLMPTKEEMDGLGIPSSEQASYAHIAYQAAFGLDTWMNIPELTPHTFATKIVPLTPHQGRALQTLYLADYSRSKPSLRMPREEAEEVVGGIAEALDAVLGGEEFQLGAFVKLATRSPKDVVVYHPEVGSTMEHVERVVEALYARKAEEGGKVTLNDEIAAFVAGSGRGLCVFSGAEAVALLSASTRVFEDINRLLAYGDASFPLALQVRVWDDVVVDRPEYEFRGFVSGGNLNALTQYFTFLASDELIENKDKVEAIILEFFAGVSPHIPHESYVIDFVLMPDNSVKIVELGTFRTTTGAGLFSWKQDRERFLNGPFEFRIVEAPWDDPIDILPKYWREYLADKRALHNPNPTSNTEGGCTVS